MTGTAIYTWTTGRRYCSTELHRTNSICPDCAENGTCAACDQPIAPGPQYLICNENGEAIHTTCSRTAAEARWVDYY